MLKNCHSGQHISEQKGTTFKQLFSGIDQSEAKYARKSKHLDYIK